MMIELIFWGLSFYDLSLFSPSLIIYNKSPCIRPPIHITITYIRTDLYTDTFIHEDVSCCDLNSLTVSALSHGLPRGHGNYPIPQTQLSAHTHPSPPPSPKEAHSSPYRLSAHNHPPGCRFEGHSLCITLYASCTRRTTTNVCLWHLSPFHRISPVCTSSSLSVCLTSCFSVFPGGRRCCSGTERWKGRARRYWAGGLILHNPYHRYLSNQNENCVISSICPLALTPGVFLHSWNIYVYFIGNADWGAFWTTWPCRELPTFITYNRCSFILCLDCFFQTRILKIQLSFKWSFIYLCL